MRRGLTRLLEHRHRERLTALLLLQLCQPQRRGHPGRAAADDKDVDVERFARHYFGNEQAVGRRIGQGGNPNTPTPIEIVGVVRDSKYTDVRDETQRQVFFSYLEASQPSGFTVYLRTSQPADRMFELVRQAMRGIDPNLPVYSTRTLAGSSEKWW